MARGFGASETGWRNLEKPGPSATAFRQAVANLSEERIKSVRDSIFFPTANAAREEALKGYKGPSAKNSFAWFKPEAEKEVHAKSQVWSRNPRIIAALEALWDQGAPGSPHRDTGLHNTYPDKETFVQRNLRFIEGDYKNAFYMPIAWALGWSPSGEERLPEKEEGIRLTEGKNEAQKAWNALMKEETARIRQEALDWLKGKI